MHPHEPSRVIGVDLGVTAPALGRCCSTATR
jgi:hypothetical protein